MTAADPGARDGSGGGMAVVFDALVALRPEGIPARHHALAIPEPHGVGWRFRAACSCGWRRDETNKKRENAIRAARRHAQEAQG